MASMHFYFPVHQRVDPSHTQSDGWLWQASSELRGLDPSEVTSLSKRSDIVFDLQCKACYPFCF